ncbi:hypothetical protein D3C74_152300 [compost metagenome]
MELHMESVRQGVIAGKEYAGFITELPTGQYMASIIATETGSQGQGEHVTKTCATKQEAIDAINEAWADLENNALK